MPQQIPGNGGRANAEAWRCFANAHGCCHEAGLNDPNRKGLAMAPQKQAFGENAEGSLSGTVGIVAGAPPIPSN